MADLLGNEKPRPLVNRRIIVSLVQSLCHSPQLRTLWSWASSEDRSTSQTHPCFPSYHCNTYCTTQVETGNINTHLPVILQIFVLHQSTVRTLKKITSWCWKQTDLRIYFITVTPKAEHSPDLCTPWKCFQYSKNKFPYSAIIFHSVFLVAPPTAEIGLKKKVAPPTAVNGK